MAWYERTKLPLFAWAPLARGYFGESPTVRMDVRRDIPIRTEDDLAAGMAFDSPGNRERRGRARELATRLGGSATQVALAWVLSQPFPTWAVIGARTVEELEASAAATDLHLTPAQVRWLSAG
jgi:aryl-alcohol dehydrogenase-like predicted oxidoreductase